MIPGIVVTLVILHASTNYLPKITQYPTVE